MLGSYVLQVLPQQRSRAMQPGLHIGFGQAHDAGDLAGGQPLHLTQEHDHTQGWRQRVQRRAEANAQPVVDRHLVRLHRSVADVHPCETTI